MKREGLVDEGGSDDMKSFGNRPPDRLIVFGRYPAPGRVKTRLIPDLGPARAAELQRRLTEKALSCACRFASGRGVEVEFRFDGGSQKRMKRWIGPGPILSMQTGLDLGERMKTALYSAFQDGCRRVVLHGTDIPGLSSRRLQRAFRELEDKDVVLGPSMDGGYWLVGLKGPADIFGGMQWGHESVLDSTLRRAKEKGLRVGLLEPLVDVDDMEDMKKILPGWSERKPYVSVIIPALNEEERIEKTIRSAADVDAEVIVVDGGSQDDTAARAALAGAAVLGSRKGRAFQQNAGAEKARGDVLLFLHADSCLPVSFAAHVFDALMDRKVVGGAFSFRTDCATPFMKAIEFMTNVRTRLFQLPYGDQGIFMPKSVFEAAGGFPDVPLGEDFLLVRRLAKMGRIATAPAAVATSARRWLKHGPIRTTAINQAVAAGMLLGVSLQTLARIYWKNEEE